MGIWEAAWGSWRVPGPDAGLEQPEDHQEPGVCLIQRSLKYTCLSLSVLQVKTEGEQTAETWGQRVLGCRAVSLAGGPLRGGLRPQPGSHSAHPAASAHSCPPTPADPRPQPRKSLTSQDPGTARALTHIQNDVPSDFWRSILEL